MHAHTYDATQEQKSTKFPNFDLFLEKEVRKCASVFGSRMSNHFETRNSCRKNCVRIKYVLISLPTFSPRDVSLQSHVCCKIEFRAETRLHLRVKFTTLFYVFNQNVSRVV